MEFVTHSAEETVALGRRLAARFSPPCIVALFGDLGSGKTTLTKGIVAGLGAAAEEEVTSPTFTLVHEYGAQPKVYHADLYRIEGAADLPSLGLDDLFAQDATVLIEWPEKLDELIRAEAISVRLELLENDDRRITISNLR